MQKKFLCRANLNFPGKSKKKRGSVMDFFSPFGDTKPFGGFGSHMSGAARGKYILEYCYSFICEHLFLVTLIWLTYFILIFVWGCIVFYLAYCARGCNLLLFVVETQSGWNEKLTTVSKETRIFLQSHNTVKRKRFTQEF